MTDELQRLNLELTSRCNYACVSCPTHELIRGKGAMEPELFKATLDETGNKLERVFLWGYGEPLLHPNINELVRYAGKSPTKKVMSTTGWKLEDLTDLESLGQLDELIISINGLTQEVYTRHQINGDLEKVMRGIRKVAPIIQDSKTRFIMQIIAHKENLKDIPKAEDFARNYGFDMLVVKSFNVMDRRQETFDRFVPLGTPFSRYKEGLNDPPKTPESGIYPCEESMVINWDGSVNPCCWDYKGKHDFGNVRDEGVYGVWNNITASKHRDQIRRGRFLDICVDCANSKTVKAISFTNKGGEDVKKSI